MTKVKTKTDPRIAALEDDLKQRDERTECSGLRLPIENSCALKPVRLPPGRLTKP
jgi:hypothetical protein